MISCNEPIFSNSDMSGNLASTPFLLKNDYGYTIQLTWTGSVTGTFTVQASNDVGAEASDGTITGVTHWTTLSGSSNAITNAGTLMYNVNLAFYRWVRIVYTASTGGTASLIGRINSKGV